MWSWLIGVITEMCGSVAFVASKRPPSPTSTTATAHPVAAKCASASAVVSSKVVGWPAVGMCRRIALRGGRNPAIPLSRSAIEMISPGLN